MINFNEKLSELLNDEEFIDSLMPFERSLRILVVIVADRSLGTDVMAEDYHPTFLHKCEGGAYINQSSLVLDKRGAYPDHSKEDAKFKKAFKALESALEEVLTAIKTRKSNFPKDTQLALIVFTQAWMNKNKLDQQVIFSKIGDDNPFTGDPWRRLWSRSWEKVVHKANEVERAKGSENVFF